MDTHNLLKGETLEKTEEKEMTLRERFDSGGRSIAQYARVRNLDKTILQYVLAGELTGERNRKGSGKVRACILQLKKDNIWTDPLPWEKEAA